MGATFMEIQGEIANMLDIPDEELTDEQRQIMDEYLNELGQQEVTKIDGFAGFIRQQTAISEAIKQEGQRLAAKAKAMQNRIDKLKEHYLSVMKIHGIKKIQGEIYSIGVRENMRVNVSDLDALVKDNNPLWVKAETTYKPDKATIREALKDGVSVPGCQLEKSYSLNIR